MLRQGMDSMTQRFLPILQRKKIFLKTADNPPLPQVGRGTYEKMSTFFIGTRVVSRSVEEGQKRLSVPLDEMRPAGTNALTSTPCMLSPQGA